MPQLPEEEEGQAPAESEPPEEVMERLAHLEQLVVQLKSLIRDKDAQLTQKDSELASKDAQFKVSSRLFIMFSLQKSLSSPMTNLHFVFLLFICRTRKKNLTLASPNSSCRPKPRWLLSTNRSLISKDKEEQL